MTKPNFKQTRFYVASNAEAQKVQEAMFTLGFMWTGKLPGAKREVRNYFGKGGYIYVDQDCRLLFCGHATMMPPYCDYTPALQKALFAAAESHRAEKRQKRKDSRKRKSLARSAALRTVCNTVLSVVREPVEEQQDTNPKRQYGVASLPLEMWPDLASAYGALALYNGALKYGKANFANTPVEASIYIAAARRHLASWVAGEEFDPADGVPHLGGVLANIAILLSARAAGTLIDDRMLLDGFLKERDALKAIVPKLQEVHAGKNPKHYTRETV